MDESEKEPFCALCMDIYSMLDTLANQIILGKLHNLKNRVPSLNLARYKLDYLESPILAIDIR